jgi:hypothetical protein
VKWLRRLSLRWLRSLFERRIDRALLRDADAFFALLRRAGYPLTGETIWVHNRPRDRARFLAAILWAIRELAQTSAKDGG